MTEAEAIDIVKDQFAGTNGFLAQLQRGQGIDEAGVSLAKEALHILKRVWADRTTVPKDAVFPLIDVLTTIRLCIDFQPEMRYEILRLAMDMNHLVEAIFLPEKLSMSEEEAMTIVQFHLGGGESLALALHTGDGLDQGSVHELQMALDTLQDAWSNRQQVPKAVVGPMLEAPSIVEYNTNLPSQLKQELAELMHDLRERVKRCLS